MNECIAIHKNGLTRKKVQCIAAHRNATFRGDFVAEIFRYNANMLVFADETGKDKHDSIRRYGYATQGKTPVITPTCKRGEDINYFLQWISGF